MKWVAFLLIIRAKFSICIDDNSDWRCDLTVETEIKCAASETEKIIIHIKEKKLEIDCHNIASFHTKLLPIQELRNVSRRKLEIRFCPVPINGYKDIVDHFSITDLKTLHLEYSENVSLTKDHFKRLDKLENLKLNELKITNLEDDVFYNIRNLYYLEMQNNENLTLIPSFFWYMRNLKALFLAENHIEEISDNLFQDLSSLQTLHLFTNNLKIIKNYTFNGLSNLTELELSGNKIERISSGAFLRTPELSIINLNNNQLRNLSKSLFKNTKIHKIYIRNNTQLVIEDYAFSGLPLLEEVDLAKCNLNIVPENLFSQSYNLKKVFLDENRLDSFPTTLFSRLVHLQELSLGGNALKVLEKEAFSDLINLEKINLQKNKLIKIYPSVFYNFVKLEELDLSHNHIKKINLTAFGKVQVSYDYNEITEIIFDNLNRANVSLSHNPINCDCKIYDLLQHLTEQESEKTSDVNITIDNFLCASPAVLSGFEFKKLPLSRLTCLETKGCPEECTCEWRPFDESIVLNCSYRNLTAFPEINFTRTNEIKFNQTEIYLEGNSLTQGPTFDLMPHNKVTKLNLSHNQIETITWLPPKLEVLAIDNNKLHHLDFEILNILNTSHLTNLNLGNNRWSCDCDAVILANFLHQIIRQNSEVEVDINNIFCSGSNNTLLINLTKADLCHSWLLNYLLPVLATLLSLSTLFIFYYRYKREIDVWMHHNCCFWPMPEEDPDKIFDAFISYSHKDEDFLVQELLPVLEAGPSPYKLCLHYRNWVPGESIAAQITKSVLDSRRTLVVLSNNFLESVWGKMEFRTAHIQAMTEGKVRVIIVMYGDVDVKILDDDLKSYLRTNTYVKWGDSHFWDKLHNALPPCKRMNVSNQNQNIVDVMHSIGKFHLFSPIKPCFQRSSH